MPSTNQKSRNNPTVDELFTQCTHEDEQDAVDAELLEDNRKIERVNAAVNSIIVWSILALMVLSVHS
jgi:hypothetical protein